MDDGCNVDLAAGLGVRLSVGLSFVLLSKNKLAFSFSIRQYVVVVLLHLIVSERKFFEIKVIN